MIGSGFLCGEYNAGSCNVVRVDVVDVACRADAALLAWFSGAAA
jgi:hypothetical protein